MEKRVALIGNPNAGKSSIFNQLTGLNQHVGNFPGVTVDKKVGNFSIPNYGQVELLDLPGTYSITPYSKDEEVVFKVLGDKTHPNHPEAAIVVVDQTNLERNLLLFTQIYELNIPTVLVFNMMDLARKQKIDFDFDQFQSHFPNVRLVQASAKKGEGIEEIKHALIGLDEFHSNNDQAESFAKLKTQERYQRISAILENCAYTQSSEKRTLSQRVDKFFVHPILGYLIFGAILLLIFQFVFTFAETPMDWIDGLFLNLSQFTKSSLPEGVFTDLLSEGIIPGIGGVVIFIPQITFLFLFIAVLEETGYMSRVVFIMDRVMRPLGLSGRSVVPLVSSMACAIPAIMAARTINSWRDRIITIMVAPLVSCSARIPVYTLLIALIVPDEKVLGFLNLKGLVLFGLYFLGFFGAIVSAWVMKWFIKAKEKSFLIMELPDYRLPNVKNTLTIIWEKVRVFVWDAGRIILAVSIVLWALASYGPTEARDQAVKDVLVSNSTLPQDELDKKVNAAKMEHSYIGIGGKFIEPAIKPLGYDWKIGVALITSFAAREVFVGSMATIYSVGDNFEEDASLLDRMKNEKDSDGKYVYTLATGASLMIFYVFAMQCMSTLAIVKRETKSWKWPLIQLGYMTLLAYGGAWITFMIFS